MTYFFMSLMLTICNPTRSDVERLLSDAPCTCIHYGPDLHGTDFVFYKYLEVRYNGRDAVTAFSLRFPKQFAVDAAGKVKK
jgi:hypothetical protein